LPLQRRITRISRPDTKRRDRSDNWETRERGGERKSVKIGDTRQIGDGSKIPLKNEEFGLPVGSRRKGGTGQIVGKRANGEGNGKASNWGRVKDCPKKRGIWVTGREISQEVDLSRPSLRRALLVKSLCRPLLPKRSRWFLFRHQYSQKYIRKDFHDGAVAGNSKS